MSEKEERASVPSMNKIHRIAGLRISRIEDAEGVCPGQNRNRLPDLEPPEERLQRQRSNIFSSDAISLSHASAVEDVFTAVDRAEHNDLTARITVYAMNLTVMAFALPVGLALLLMNVLGGENLRTTAHIMALTGLFSALMTANPGLFSTFL
jgi:hypothetical protein